MKKTHAQAIVVTAAFAATGEGAVPIPFSDCALLFPTQLKMKVSITVIFGFDVNKSGIFMAFLRCECQGSEK
ncbi:hypothetical protein [Holdemanella biformis]|uniref:hypothetical protein n=1 Tax=Holdemanella biformis TaxID=1735 RepID=UPI003AB7E077